MLNTFTHGRAAILCFGGWGLQVMLHLWPRLQAVQEQRAALGATGADFSRITSFTTVLPEALLDANSQAQFYLRQPRLEQILQPFYAEKLLAKLDRELPDAFDAQTAGMLTMAEKRAALLLRSVEAVLKPLDYAGTGFSAPAVGLSPHVGRIDAQTKIVRRATRVDQFRTALTHAEHIARLLEIHLLDPIRQDNLVEDDPFVQTTLYVIAPLFEPLAAALVWPLVTQLMARVGHRQVAQVVALLGTGSYASDLTRSVEDAAAFAALAELEILTGVHRDPEDRRQAVVRTLVNSAAPHMADLVGQPLFDTVYLLDREKSNQGLAQDSHELAVMAANALEALIVASGNLLIQEQLGYGLHGGATRPYSLIGAASDYVPLAQLMHAVNRQEESRLVREWVLRNTDEEPNGQNPLTRTLAHSAMLLGLPQQHNLTLSELGLTQAEALAQLTLRMPDFHAGAPPATVEELAVHEAFVLPKPIALDLRRTPPPLWGEAFQTHLGELGEYIKLAVGAEAVDEAWGTQAVETGHEWTLHEDDDRLLPRTVTWMHERLLEILAASPTGLTGAQNQVKRWLQETEQARQRVWSIATPNARQLARAQRQLALRNWTANYTQAVINTPTFFAIMLRTALAIAVVAIFAFGYLLVMQRAWNPVADGISLLGFAVGILLTGLAIYRLTSNRIRKLRRERVTLAQLELTAQLQEKGVDGLVRGYDRLAQLLNTWSQMLTEAIGELNALSTPPAIPVVPPPGVPPITLYQPHLSQALWNRCLEYLRTQQDTQGQRSEERLGRMWGTAAWRNDMKRILSGGAPTTGQSPARTIAQFIRNTVRQSVAPVSIEYPNSVRAELIRNLAQEFSIEHLLWRNTEAEAELARRLRALERGNRQPLTNDAKDSLPHRRYVEMAWSRAKPAGNYDVADRLAVYGTTIDFAAVSGDASSDLTRALLDEFNLSLLSTDNPFSITFVRTVHGLGLDDLEATKRYRAELEYLSPEERALVLLIDDPNDTFYEMPATDHPRAYQTLQYTTGATQTESDKQPKLTYSTSDRN